MNEIEVFEAVPMENTASILVYDNSPVIDAFIAWCDLKPRSKETYRYALKFFFSWVRSEGISKPKRSDIVRYKEYLVDAYSSCTVSSYLTAVRSFFEFLNAEMGYPNIAAGVKNPKSRQGQKKDALSIEQAKHLLASMPTSTLAQKRDFAIVKLQIQAALRCIEICRANIEDLRSNLGKRILWVWGKGKDGKDEYVVIAPSVEAAILDYLKAREAVEGRLKESAPLLASVSRRDYGKRMNPKTISRLSKEALKRAGLDDPRLTAHSLRHTAVTLALLGGAEIRDVQKMARHSSPVTTERYAHDIRRMQDTAEQKIEGLLLD